MRRIAFGLSAGLVQVACAMAVHWAWQSSAGAWSGGIWILYFVGFPIAAPALAIGLGALWFGVPATLPRLLGTWSAVAFVSAAYIVVAHGLEDAGWPFWASVLAYGSCVGIAGALACAGAHRASDIVAPGARLR